MTRPCEQWSVGVNVWNANCVRHVENTDIEIAGRLRADLQKIDLQTYPWTWYRKTVKNTGRPHKTWRMALSEGLHGTAVTWRETTTASDGGISSPGVPTETGRTISEFHRSQSLCNGWVDLLPVVTCVQVIFRQVRRCMKNTKHLRWALLPCRYHSCTMTDRYFVPTKRPSRSICSSAVVIDGK